MRCNGVVTDLAPAGEEDLRKWAIKRLKRKRELRDNLIIFVIINGALWLIWALSGTHTNQEGVPWPVWITGVCALILLLQALRLHSENPISESEIRSEMDRLHRTEPKPR